MIRNIWKVAISQIYPRKSTSAYNSNISLAYYTEILSKKILKIDLSFFFHYIDGGPKWMVSIRLILSKRSKMWAISDLWYMRPILYYQQLKADATNNRRSCKILKWKICQITNGKIIILLYGKIKQLVVAHRHWWNSAPFIHKQFHSSFQNSYYNCLLQFPHIVFGIFC